MESINNLITEKQVNDFNELLLQYGGDIDAIDREFIPTISPTVIEPKVKFEPFLVIGEFQSVKHLEKTDKYDAKSVYLFNFTRYVGGEPMRIPAFFWGFAAFDSQFEKLKITKGDRVKIKYMGKFPHPKNPDRTSHSCFVDKLKPLK